MAGRIVRHTELEVYKKAFGLAMEIFRLSESFPKDEIFSLTDQIRRSSRSVCANLAEGWRKRRYEGAFVLKLTEAEGEAAETQTWIEFAVECNYVQKEVARKVYQSYDEVIATLVGMIVHADTWIITRK